MTRTRLTAREILDAATLESNWQATVTDCASTFGWTWYHTHDSRRSSAGFPDLVIVKPPRLLFAELKREGEYPTAKQRMWLALLRAVPCIEVYVWRPSDWEMVKQVMRGERRL